MWEGGDGGKAEKASYSSTVVSTVMIHMVCVASSAKKKAMVRE
jgi:hypothetical protein